MKYTAEKKQTIVLYILEKIAAGTQSLSKVVAETFGISTNTVHGYLNAMIEDVIIAKQKRGKYELVNSRREYTFDRDAGELESDTLPYELCLAKEIKHLGENVQRIWNYGLSEMVNNVIDHSNAKRMKVIVTQNYLTTSEKLTRALLLQRTY